MKAGEGSRLHRYGEAVDDRAPYSSTAAVAAVGFPRSTRTPRHNIFQVSYVQQINDYAAALEWGSGLIAGTRSEALGVPTPCSDWDVRHLVGHLIGTAHRGRGTATGVSTADVPHVVTDVPDDRHAATYAQLAGEVVQAFASLD